MTAVRQPVSKFRLTAITLGCTVGGLQIIAIQLIDADRLLTCDSESAPMIKTHLWLTALGGLDSKTQQLVVFWLYSYVNISMPSIYVTVQWIIILQQLMNLGFKSMRFRLNSEWKWLKWISVYADKNEFVISADLSQLDTKNCYWIRCPFASSRAAKCDGFLAWGAELRKQRAAGWCRAVWKLNERGWLSLSSAQHPHNYWLSISPFLVNETLRYLNSSTWSSRCPLQLVKKRRI